MAQMKHMHYAALETMERQQEFLKAQLEATVAAYARKLTNDYNGRIKALEAEYQRRLEGLNKTAMGDLQATLEAAQRDTRNMEARTQKQILDKEAEIEQERKMFGQKVQMARQAAEEADAEVEKLRKTVADKDKEIDRLNVDLRVAQASGGMDNSSSGLGGGGGGDAALREKIAHLETELDATRTERDQLAEDRAAFEHAVDERDQEIAQLQDQIAQFAEGGGGDLVVGGEEEEEEEEEGGVIVAGDDEEEEEGGGIEIA
jgi:chromosome segregation ATPase